MVADKGKRAKFEEAEAEEINGELVASVEKLQDIQDELEKINEEESEKVLEVEQECNELCSPVYSRRNEIIQSIPDFWLTAFLNHPVLGELLSEKDQKIFKHLVSLDVEDFKDSNSGYSITFNFSANPYFEDKKLTKTYSFDKGIMGTTIKWKEGISIVNGVAHKKKGSKRPHAAESFFSWFHVGQQEDISEGIFDEVAVIIKEDLWPNPLIYFNNEVDEEDFVGEEEEEEDDDDDEYHNEEKGTDGDEDKDEDKEDNN